MKTLIVLLMPIFTYCQTLVFDGNYKLTNDMNITVDSIIGNGHTLYLHCGAKLTVRKYAGRITFGTMRYTYERCDPSNEIEVLEGARLFKVASCEFINITGAVKQPNPNKGGGKTKNNTRQ